MRTGADLTGSPAVQVETVIRVNGTIRPHEEWSLDQAISADIPNAVDGGELVASRGTVKWATPTGVRPRNPFLRVAGWPPAPGDRVTIDQVTTAAGQSQTSRVFTGKIDRTPGGVSAGNTSTIVDDIDLLRRTVNLRPMQYAMPADDAPGKVPAGVQLSAITPVVQALMECGFDATPPPPNTGLATIGAGSLFPVRGRLATTPWAAREISIPERTKWGMATHVPLNPDNTVSPCEIYAFWGSNQPTPSNSTPWWFAVDFPRWNQTMAQVILIAGFVDQVTITLFRVGDQIHCFLTKTRDESRGEPKAILQVPADDARVVCRITYTPNLTVELRHDGSPDSGVTATGGVPSTSVDMAMMRGWQGVVGAMQLTYGSQYTWDRWLRFKPNAILDIAPRTGHSSLGASMAHPQHNKTALELIKQAASALVACIWIDEDARFHWADVEALNAKPVALTVKAGRILDLAWDDPSVTYRRVGVTYKKPLIQGGAKSPQPNVIVWRGSGSTLKDNEESTVWIQPENSDVDWIVVDTELNPTGDVQTDPQVRQRINQGTRSACVAVFTKDGQPVTKNGEVMLMRPGTDYDRLLEKVDWQTYTWHAKPFIGDSDQYAAQFRVPENIGVVPMHVGDVMPQVCAWARTERTDTTVWGSNLGPAEGADYAHDAGPWIQTEEHANRLRKFLEPRLTAPRPVITGVQIVADARLQRGDKIRLEDTEVTGLAVEGIVYRIRHTGKAGEYRQELSLWLTKIDTPLPTYQQVQDYYDGHTYAQLQTLKSGITYAADQTNPMR